jgi:hypothetical protein
VTRVRENVTHESENVTRSRENVTRARENVTRERECDTCEKDEKCMQNCDCKTEVNRPLRRYKRVCGLIILKWGLNN